MGIALGRLGRVQHPHPGRQRRRHVDHVLTRRHQLLRQQITQTRRRLDRPPPLARTEMPSPTTRRTASSTTAPATRRARSRRGQPQPQCVIPCAGRHRSLPSSSPVPFSSWGTATGTPDDNKCVRLLRATPRTGRQRHGCSFNSQTLQSAGTSRAVPPAPRTLRNNLVASAPFSNQAHLRCCGHSSMTYPSRSETYASPSRVRAHHGLGPDRPPSPRGRRHRQ